MVISVLAILLAIGAALVVNNLVDQSSRHVNAIKKIRVKYVKSSWNPQEDECVAQLKHDLETNPKIDDANYSDMHLSKHALHLLGKLVNIKRLDMSSATFNNEDLDELRSMNVNILLLRGTSLNDVGLKKLTQIKSIHVIEVAEDKISEEAFKYFKDFPHLAELNLNDMPVTPRGISYLAPIKTLQTLIFGYRTLTMEQIDEIVKLDSISILDLTGCTGLTPEMIAKLGAMKSLVRLAITQCDVGDEHLEVAATLPNARILLIKSNPFTDKGLKSLEKMKSLVHVEITDCRNLTNNAIAHFKKSKPNCFVVNAGNRKTILERLDPSAQEYVDKL